jgi:hypothetical protein
VRIVELSNHPGEMLQQQYEQRARAEQQQQAVYEQAVAQHRARVDQALQECLGARAARRWWTWLRCRFALWRLQVEAPRQPPPVFTDAHEEAKVTAGIRGEQAVIDRLASLFGDDWVDLCGYRNRRGEIDQILVGPRGIIAIEVKYRNATVHCAGDDWWYEKYDQYGNCVEDGWITDQRGRSPSVQLTEPVRELEGFLARRGQPIGITPIVLLTHPRSVIGSTTDLTVDVSTDAGDVAQLAAASPHALDPQRCGAIEELIVHDHAFHENRRRSRRKR